MREKASRNNLVALGTAAVLTIYGAGYARTQAAAERIDRGGEERRSIAPAPAPAPVSFAPADSPAPEVAPSGSPETTVPAAPPAPTAESPALPEPALTVVDLSTPEPGPLVGSSAVVAEMPAPVLPPSAVLPSAPVPPPTPVAAPVQVAAAPPPAPASKYKDGRYSGWGTSRHGDIQATVEIANGRILSATISSCRTRYPCSRIDMIVPQVAQRQSPEVDNVSRATQSSDAFYYAVLEALKKAQ